MTYDDWRFLNSKLINKTPEENCEELLRWHSAAKRGLNFETDYTTSNYEKSFKIPFTYFLSHVENPFSYNRLYNTFLKVLEENIIIKDISVELESIPKPKKTKTKTKKKVVNKYYRVETRDIFGVVTYNYINPKTGDSFYSPDPDLLEELNKPRTTNRTVSLDDMTFSFTKLKKNV